MPHSVLFDKGTSKVPVFAWVDGVQFEGKAVEQAMLLSQMPWAFKHIAIMPDVHAGYGSTVGSVIATRDVVMPAAVGVDIGCGMTAVKTTLQGKDLTGRDLAELRALIEAVVPCGFGAGGPVGTWADSVPADVVQVWDASLSSRYELEVCYDLPKVRHKQPLAQLGTLGSGNHFVEICLDTEGAVWIMLHSGSRGAGNRIGTEYSKLAQELCERWHAKLPHKELAFIPQGEAWFDRYVRAVTWAQEYALASRTLMLQHTKDALHEYVRQEFFSEEIIACHHNYLARENHFGSNVWVTRKGAVRARTGDKVIIPGSMGARSIIGEGLGNPESFTSCSHGAGRTMSRTKARAEITLEQHQQATEGIYCDKTVDTIDESPAAYKDIDAVLKAEYDLVKPLVYLKQIVCVKGKS